MRSVKSRLDTAESSRTHVFDVGAGVDGDDIAVLDTQVVSHNTVDASASIIEIIIGQNNQNGVLALLALDEDGVTPEQLEGVHCVVGESNNGVVIVDGIGDTSTQTVSTQPVSPHQGQS